MAIDPTAVVDPRAELGDGVEIGPYSVVGAEVTIGARCVIGSHVVLEGPTSIGARNRIGNFAYLGGPPQDVSYKGENTRLKIGDDNIIREYVTIHRATTKEDWETVVGSRNYIMAYAHVGHDCRLGDDIIMANGVQLGGHVHIGNGVGIGGLTAVHQFVSIGDYAFIGGMSAVSQDVPPYMMASGGRARLYGLNQRGLTRAGFDPQTIKTLRKVYRILWRETTVMRQGMQRLREEFADSAEVQLLLQFLENARRGVMR